MGQKVHPTGFRLGIATDWTSKWYADSDQFADFLDEDLKIREFSEERNWRRQRLVASRFRVR